jgi:transposase
MFHIRKTKTSSGATAIQVVRYENRRLVVDKHIGSAHSKDELSILLRNADHWIESEGGQGILLDTEPKRTSKLINLETTEYRGVTYNFAYDVISAVLARLGFTDLNDPLCLDLVLIRLFEPASKLRSVELMKKYFGVTHGLRQVYESLPKLIKHKTEVERLLVSQATNGGTIKLSFILYDVTTLYFESFESDNLRKPGFSKDGKSQQPQIVIGLLVDTQGFPLGYEVFAGNTFEGNTMLPVVQDFCAAHKISSFTIVADAAMISMKNVKELKEKKLSYIVGARLANLSPILIDRITDDLRGHVHGQTIRIPTEHGDLISSFSDSRYRKDKSDMEKQIAKAKRLVLEKNLGKKAKFLAVSGGTCEFNEALATRAEKLLGIKGYYTNVPVETMDDTEVIEHYSSLWRVEQTFRMSKSDLETRPIFHHLEDSVKAHMLICIMALATGKYMEQKIGLSLRRINDLLKSVTDAKMVDTITGKTFTMRSTLSDETKDLLEKLNLSY